MCTHTHTGCNFTVCLTRCNLSFICVLNSSSSSSSNNNNMNTNNNGATSNANRLDKAASCICNGNGNSLRQQRCVLVLMLQIFALINLLFANKFLNRFAQCLFVGFPQFSTFSTYRLMNKHSIQNCLFIYLFTSNTNISYKVEIFMLCKIIVFIK